MPVGAAEVLEEDWLTTVVMVTTTPSLVVREITGGSEDVGLVGGGVAVGALGVEMDEEEEEEEDEDEDEEDELV